MLECLIETHALARNAVAASTGVAESTISDVLAGKRRLGVKLIAALARVFKAKAAVLLDD
jgi:antitoxin component HigA of HigAB toxin-antitoxin module